MTYILRVISCSKLLNQINHHVMMTYWGRRGIPPAFLTSALDGVEWSDQSQAAIPRYTPGECLYPLCKELSGPPEQIWTLPGIEPRLYKP
jgi:hypothetical protein